MERPPGQLLQPQPQAQARAEGAAIAPFLLIEDYAAPAPSAPSEGTALVEAGEADGQGAPDTGQLAVRGVAVHGLGGPEGEEEGPLRAVYLVVQLESQQVRSRAARLELAQQGQAQGAAQWAEEMLFDVPSSSSSAAPPPELNLALWGVVAASGCPSPAPSPQPPSPVLGAAPPEREVRFLGSVAAALPEPGQQAALRLALSPGPGVLSLELAHTARRGRRVGVEDFEPLKVIGRGHFGKVVLVRKRDTGRVYAMKVLRKDRVIATAAVGHTLTERNVLSRVRHPFLVSLKYSFQTRQRLYLVLDYVNGGELFFHLARVERFAEERARFYAAEIVLALGYLHSLDVLYRDLKPENLLLDMAGHICVTDFGLVKEGVAPGGTTNTFCGSPEYLAPEMLRGQPYGRGADWWALGTLVYEMLAGLPPFYAEQQAEMHARILSAPLTFDPALFTPLAMDFIRRLLARDPAARLGAGPDDCEELKRHAWFAPIDWRLLYEKRLQPPFRPHVRHALDVQNFEPEFTSEAPNADSYKPDSALRAAALRPSALAEPDGAGAPDAADAAFQNFSYVAPDLLLRRRYSAYRLSASPQPSGGGAVGALAVPVPALLAPTAGPGRRPWLPSPELRTPDATPPLPPEDLADLLDL